MIVAAKYYCYYCFTTVHKSAQCAVKYISNCDKKAENKCYNLVKKFHCFLEIKYVYKKKTQRLCTTRCTYCYTKCL